MILEKAIQGLGYIGTGSDLFMLHFTFVQVIILADKPVVQLAQHVERKSVAQLDSTAFFYFVAEYQSYFQFDAGYYQLIRNLAATRCVSSTSAVVKRKGDVIRHVVMLLFSLFTEKGLVGEIEVDDVVIVEALQVFAGKADRLALQFRPRRIIVLPAMHQRHQVFGLDHGVAFHRPAVGKEIKLDARCTFAFLNYIQVYLAGTLAEAVEESELIVAEDELRHPSALTVLIYLALKQAVEEAITRLIAHLERQFDRFSG